MSITSLPFFVFFALSLALYYLLPKRCQWGVLLGCSLVFFGLSSPAYTVVYLALGVIATALCARGIARARENGSSGRARAALAVGLAVDLGLLAVLKYTGFFLGNVNRVGGWTGLWGPLPVPDLLAPLGISFYTLQSVGYLLDAYWDICPIQPSVWKTALFVGYYPQLTSGPIARYRDMHERLYAPHGFDSRRVAFGLQRMLWGIFKKLVISARAGVVANTVFADPAAHPGFLVWIGAALFTLQLYTDFSGCMDIVLGISECYGIPLPENFRTPFFSRSVQEFWQRWHITLGAWLKDYLLYPLMRSRPFAGLTRWLREHVGKKAARQLPSLLGMLCVWLLIGLWHGGSWKYILGMGLWFWGMIAAAQVLAPVFRKCIRLLKIRTDAFSWHLFQSLRVFVLVVVGNVFFRADSLSQALGFLRAGLLPRNPEIFFDGSLYALGLDRPDFLLLMACILLLVGVSAVQERGSVREQIARQNLVFRWLIWFGLLFGVLVLGQYGPGYDPAAFIYGQF